jgi:hypothetical protein
MHYYGALFDEDTHELKEPICKQFDWPRTGDVLILDRIEVLAAYRKHRIGLAAACSFIDTFGGDTDGLVVGTPHPLQFSTDTLAANKEWAQKMQYENFSRNKKLATTKLQNHWAKLGMKRLKGIKINGSPVYGLSLSLKRPTTAQVLRMP